MLTISYLLTYCAVSICSAFSPVTINESILLVKTSPPLCTSSCPFQPIQGHQYQYTAILCFLSGITSFSFSTGSFLSSQNLSFISSPLIKILLTSLFPPVIPPFTSFPFQQKSFKKQSVFFFNFSPPTLLTPH